VDEDEEKTREIDIFALHNSSYFSLREMKRGDIFLITSNLVAECKKTSTHAWILFTRPRPANWANGPPNGHVTDFLDGLTGGKQSFFSQIDWPRVHYDQFRRIAYNYVEVKLSKDIHTEDKSAFEALSQLWKCLSYNSKQNRELFAKDRTPRPLMIYFPVIVLDGKLYEAIGPTGKLRPAARQHMILSVKRRSKALGDTRDFLIDVVTREFFPRYLKMVEGDVSVLRRWFKENQGRLMSIADSLVQALP
jgi:hypothetical protein